MSSRSKLHVTHNFAGNLEAVRQFLEERGASASFEQLLEKLFAEVLPNLRRFPELGAGFLERVPASIEGRARRQALEERLGSGILREYIWGDYLVLYAVRVDDLFLLSIKHHLQLSYDLKRFYLS